MESEKKVLHSKFNLNLIRPCINCLVADSLELNLLTQDKDFRTTKRDENARHNCGGYQQTSQ